MTVYEYEIEAMYHTPGDAATTFVYTGWAYSIADALTQAAIALHAQHPAAKVDRVLRGGPPQRCIEEASKAEHDLRMLKLGALQVGAVPSR